MSKRCARLKAKYLPYGEGPFGALPANLKFIHWSLCIRKNRKIEPQDFKIFYFKNCRQTQNEVVKLK